MPSGWIATRVAGALRLLGPPTPPADELVEEISVLAAELITDDDADVDQLVLDVVTAHGVGWRRELEPAGRGWKGYWPKAYTRFHRLVRDCCANSLGGLTDRIGVWFPTERPDPDLLASELVSLLTDPVTPSIEWPLTIANQGSRTAVRSARHEYGDAPHGSKMVFQGEGQALACRHGALQARYERDGQGRAVETRPFTRAGNEPPVRHPLLGASARLVVAARYAETSIGAPHVEVSSKGVAVKLGWEETLKEDMALEVQGEAGISIVKCTCGHYRCAELHRLEAWSPGTVAAGFEQMVRAAASEWRGRRETRSTGYWRVLGEAAERKATQGKGPRFLPLAAFVYASLSGSYGPVKMKSFKDGMLYGTLSSRGW